MLSCSSIDIRWYMFQLLLLSPLLTAFCCAAPWTPFNLHQFVATVTTDDTQPETTVNDCATLFDWCITASHHETASTTSSVLATVLAQPPDFDDVLHEWLHTTLANAFPNMIAPIAAATMTATAYRYVRQRLRGSSSGRDFLSTNLLD